MINIFINAYIVILKAGSTGCTLFHMYIKNKLTIQIKHVTYYIYMS